MYSITRNKSVEAGSIVKSLKGHDTGRIYVVLDVISDCFVLVVDGEYRKKDNPKQKRIKHLEFIREGQFVAELNDSAIRKLCKL